MATIDDCLKDFPDKLRVFYREQLEKVAVQGDLDKIKYISESMREIYYQKPFEMAASGGHLDIVKYLWELKIKKETEEGEEDQIEYLDYKKLLEMAASGGHLDIFKYLLGLMGDGDIEESLPGSLEAATATAAAGGDLEIVGYILNLMREYCLDDLIVLEKTKWNHNMKIFEYIEDEMKKSQNN